MYKNKLIYVVCILLIAAPSVYFYFYDKEYFIVRNVNVHLENSSYASVFEDGIKKVIKKSLSDKAIQVNIWQISLNDLRQAVISSPWYDDVKISRALPSTLNVHLHMKEVVFLKFNRTNAFQPVTSEGESLPVLPSDQLPDAPILRLEGGVNGQKNLRRVIDSYYEIPLQGEVSREELAEVIWSFDEGLSLKILKQEGKIIIGRSEISKRIKRAIEVLNYLDKQQKKWRVIDASYKKKVLVKLRNRS